MFERYTEKARRIIFFARYEASIFGSQYIESEHLLLGLLREDKALALRIQVNAEAIRKDIEATTKVGEKVATSVDLPLSHDSKRALAYGAQAAESLKHTVIDTSHLLLGLLRVESSSAAILLNKHGVRYHAVFEMVRTSEAPSSTVPRVRLSIDRPVDRLSAWNDPQAVQPAAPFLLDAILRLQQLVDGALANFDLHSEAYGDEQLKRRAWSRKEALGHLIDRATAHHQWFARALTEPRITTAGYPTEEWAAALQYQKSSWPHLVDAWLAMNRLIVHVLSVIPAEKLKTECRIGIAEPIPLSALIDQYIAYTEDVITQILSKL